MYTLDFCCLHACFESSKSFVLHKLLFPLGDCIVKRPIAVSQREKNHRTGAKADHRALAAGLSTRITLAADTQETCIGA